MENARLNNSGLSLVELLVAMVVLLFVSLAMMQTALVGVDTNMRNVLRDEGVRVAAQVLDFARDLPYDQLAGYDGYSESFSRTARNMADKEFKAYLTVTPLPKIEYMRVRVRVEWEWKGEIYNTTASTLL